MRLRVPVFKPVGMRQEWGIQGGLAGDQHGVSEAVVPDQRHITLEFKRDKGDVILARVPSEPNVAIVGYYLLFVIDSTGRPSTGRFVQICLGRQRPPRPPWRDPTWWDWLRELLRNGRQLLPEEICLVERETLGHDFPPRRRPLFNEPHGHGGHEHDGHDHGGGHGAGGDDEQTGEKKR